MFLHAGGGADDPLNMARGGDGNLAPVRLRVLDRGAHGSLPPRVLLHGLGGDAESWALQVPVFAAECRVVVPELRGFGRSPRGQVHTAEAMAADVWAAMERLGIDRFDLVGHSMGGAVAQQMAVDRPDRIRRLVLADTLPSFVTDTLRKRFGYGFRLVTMSVFGPGFLSRTLAHKLYPRADQAGLRRRIIGDGDPTDRRVYLETLRALKGWTVAHRLRALQMPVLLLVAEEDYFPLADAKRFVAALPNARLRVFAGTHHFLPLEIPRQFNDVVSAFLNEPVPGKR